MSDNSKTAKRLTSSMVLIVLLAFCLAATSFALVYASVTVDGNLFQTGNIKIDFNDGQSIIDAQEFLFEPGMTVVKDCFIENEGTEDVYYKLYFDNIDGDLADVMIVTIQESGKTLYTGTASSLTRDNVTTVDDVLKTGEQQNLKIYFHFPAGVGSTAQNATLSFRLCADATQTENNPNKLFV